MLLLKHHSMDKNAYSKAEEWLNTFSHALGFLLSMLGIVVLIIKSETAAEHAVSIVYGSSLAFMFMSSTLYHFSQNEARKAVLRRIDHIAIYLLIAGSYTPFMLLAVGGLTGLLSTLLIWAIGLAGIAFKIVYGNKYPKISISTYALMGWLALFFIYPIYDALSAAGFTLLLIGGLCYSAGIPLYMLKSRHYSHALWHIAVVAGSACHFFAIYYHVI